MTFTAQLPSGTSLTTFSFQDQPDPAQSKLLCGWNLISTGDNVSPCMFNHGLSLTPPSPEVVPLNITTLWAWDSTLGNWYFHAPSMEASGALLNHITSKNYLGFGVKKLEPGMGFWINRP
jgi:hypothetical protein